MSWSRLLALAAVGVLLAGCGFRPLYGRAAEGRTTASELSAVAVGAIPDRLGQIVRNRLSERLAPRGAPVKPLYRLDIVLTRSSEGLAITRAEEITRSNLVLTAGFVLHDLRGGEPVFRGHSRSVASFNLVLSDFANLVAERDAERRVARGISDQIVTQLAVYFSRRPAS